MSAWGHSTSHRHSWGLLASQSGAYCFVFWPGPGEQQCGIYSWGRMELFCARCKLSSAVVRVVGLSPGGPSLQLALIVMGCLEAVSVIARLLGLSRSAKLGSYTLCLGVARGSKLSLHASIKGPWGSGKGRIGVHYLVLSFLKMSFYLQRLIIIKCLFEDRNIIGYLQLVIALI